MLARCCASLAMAWSSRARSNPTCAESAVGDRQINALAEKSSLHFCGVPGSGGGSERWRFVFGKAHALGQDNAEAVEEGGLGNVGLRHAAQADLAVCCGRQHDIVRLNASELLENGARRVSETGTLLPHLEAFPQHESEEANEDVSLNSILALMPDRTQVQRKRPLEPTFIARG